MNVDRRLVHVAFVGAAIMGAGTAAFAQSAPQSPGRVLARAETDVDAAHQVGLLLRCPVCQGMPISESPSEMAQAMMKVVREQLAEGKSQSEILAYFVDRYGEWVLLEPKREGLNLVLWGAPPLAILAGLWVLRRAMKRTGAAIASKSRAPSAQAPTSSESATASDPYVAAIRREIEE